MKKFLIRAVSLALMLVLVLCVPVVAHADNINLGVKVEKGTDTITVTVDNSTETNNILAAQKPTLTVPCSFGNAYVTYGGQRLPSTFADGQVSFTVAQGGTYTIHKDRLGGNKPSYIQVGPELRVGIGFVDGAIVGLKLSNSGGWTYDPNYPEQGVDISHCLVAFSNYGQTNEELVKDQKLYDELMKTLTVKLEAWINDDGSNYVPELTTYEGTAGGVKTTFFRLVVEPGKLGEGLISMSFKYNNRDFTVYLNFLYSNPNIEVEVGKDVDLQQILSSGSALEEYLSTKHPNEYAKYNGSGYIKLKLPAKTYNDVITVNLTGPTNKPMGSVQLIGHEEGTKIAGLVTRDYMLSYVANIVFEGTGSGKAFVHTGSNGQINAIHNCTFKNYGCAIEEVSAGFIRNIINCHFEDCDIGIRLASSAGTSGVGMGAVSYYENRFVNNKTAIAIEGLADVITPFRTRICDNTFLYNETDFDLQNFRVDNSDNGKIHFYFERNYFGKNNPNGGTGDQLANQVRGPAAIKVDKSEIKVITNPVRKTIDETDEYWIYTGTNQHAAIFNSEAGNMRVDGDSFRSNSAKSSATDDVEEIPVSIVDDNGNEIGKWIF